MMNWSGPKGPSERALDLALYAPLGLALSIAEVVPELARKGRARLEPQVGMARAVGQLAVHQGYRQLMRLASAGAVALRRPSATGAHPSAAQPVHGPATKEPANPEPATAGPATVEAATNGASRRAGRGPSRQSGPASRASNRGGKDPSAADLAIPSYDSLSAPQVVQRLGGLSRPEVAAVRDYELATRGRRTILSRAEQLLW
jgi:hypothetical protein